MAISAEYQKYLDSPKWKARRRKALQWANYTCERCRKTKATQVHHNTYERIFKEKLADLEAVCDECHMKIHGIEKPKKSSAWGSLRSIWERVIG